MNKFPLFAFLLCSFPVIFSQTNYNLPITTKVEQGVIEGNYDTRSGMQTYFGIPFAQPPVGELRFKAPKDPEKWEGIKETKEFGPRPVQGIVFGDMKSRSAGLNEDCLYLNVWTPAKKEDKDLPVLVYFYGGGFVAGDASEPRYDGESMAKRGVVVVTVNYRLGIFGFLAHPKLSEEASYKASGNYGLLDQQIALKWVKNNIEAFGGSSKRVTIAGESAGSISVSYQMASPLSKDLITGGVIGESGAGIAPTLAPVSLKEAEKQGQEFLEQAGVATIEALREMSTREIFEIHQESGRFGFPVVIDNYFLPRTLPDIFKAKEQAQVPLLVGWNSAEMPGVTFMQGTEYTKENFRDKVEEVYPENSEEVFELFPTKNVDDIEWAATHLASDRFIVYSTWKWFDLHRKNSQQPVYRYLFSKIRPKLIDNNKVTGLAGGTNEKEQNDPPEPKPIGAPHAAEIEYALGNLHRVDDFAWTEEDYKVSETMLDYFANFVKRGNPNSESLPEWEAAEENSETPKVMVIDTTSKVKKAVNDKRFEFWDRYFKAE